MPGLAIGLGEPDDLAVVIYEFSWRLAVFPFHLMLNEASTVQEPLDVGQAVAFLAADG